MKTNKIVLIIALLIFSIQAFSQLTYTNNGMLGIRRTPSFNLDVEGTARFSNWTDVVIDWTGRWSNPVLYPVDNWQLELGKENQAVNTLWTYQVKYSQGLYKYSDKRLKKDISPLQNTMELLKKTSAISYHYNFKINDNAPDNIKLTQNQIQYGYIAQDFKNVFPDLVSQNDDSLGYYSIDYVGLIPIITEALKEQQTQISTLQSLVYSQEKEIIELKKEVEKLSKKNDSELKSASTSTNDLSDIEQNSNLLMQNSPNPFTVDTEIKYFISDEVSSARLIIHDMQGVEIFSYVLNERGNGSKIIQASELKAGMYLYTLIADGKIIDSKRMILTSE